MSLNLTNAKNAKASLTTIITGVEATKIDLELEDWFLILLASQGHEVP